MDQTLNKGSWDHIEQITTVTTTFVQATFVLRVFLHISNISIFKQNTLDFSLVEFANMIESGEVLLKKKEKNGWMSDDEFEQKQPRMSETVVYSTKSKHV